MKFGLSCSSKLFYTFSPYIIGKFDKTPSNNNLFDFQSVLKRTFPFCLNRPNCPTQSYGIFFMFSEKRVDAEKDIKKTKHLFIRSFHKFWNNNHKN